MLEAALDIDGNVLEWQVESRYWSERILDERR